jgi:hypothetical protein
MLDFNVEHSPNQVPFRRPKVKQTLIVLAGDGILRLRQIKYCSTVIEDDGVSCSCEKIFHCTSQRLRGHS